MAGFKDASIITIIVNVKLKIYYIISYNLNKINEKKLHIYKNMAILG